jgi:hypothetical protein
LSWQLFQENGILSAYRETASGLLGYRENASGLLGYRENASGLLACLTLDRNTSKQQNRGNWENYYGQTAYSTPQYCLSHCRGDYSSHSYLLDFGSSIPPIGYG